MAEIPLAKSVLIAISAVFLTLNAANKWNMCACVHLWLITLGLPVVRVVVELRTCYKIIGKTREDVGKPCDTTSAHLKSISYMSRTDRNRAWHRKMPFQLTLLISSRY